MKIEVGKKYELNNGDIVECTRMFGDDPLWENEAGGPFYIGGFLYRQDGTIGACGNHELNVKREVHDALTRDPELTSPYGDNNHPLPPVTGTLKELNVKPGDVVEFVEGSEGFSDYTRKYHGTKSIVDEFVGTKIHDDGSQGWDSECTHIFRIISRASDTPKTWGEMTDVEKGALLLAWQQGKGIEFFGPSGWEQTYCDPTEWDVDAYRIRPEPKRETVIMVVGQSDCWGGGEKEDSLCVKSHRITFTTTDGKPDLDSIKMEEV